MNKRIVNVVNFVRGIEPRVEMDLYTPVKEQIKFNKMHGIPNTFLLQYDAMIRDDFRELFLRERDENMELGVWFENCRELIEKIGLTWHGRYDWDWHVNVGFLEGYTVHQRERIIDIVFETFKNLFGAYPQVAGSWVLDSHSMEYMCRKYGMKAFCNCREQYAVDAYTLWGGYFSGGYYPSKNNMLCPAQRAENKIPAPVFRMLGADPIYSYDELKYAPGGPVWSMEPTWQQGQNPEMIDWYLDTYFKSPCLTHAQVTTGQENSFGWDNFGAGYCMQIEKIVRMQNEGYLMIQKLGDTGAWYQSEFSISAPTAQVALIDWNKKGVQSVWYNCKNYRTNVFLYNGKLLLRDLTKYDDRYRERYLTERCEDYLAIYDNLPIVDSRIWSKNDKECELYLKKTVMSISAREECDTVLWLDVRFLDGSTGSVFLSEKEMLFCGCGELAFCCGTPDPETKLSFYENKIIGRHNNFDYEVLVKGKVIEENGSFCLCPENDSVGLVLNIMK